MKLAFSSNAFRKYSLPDSIGILSLIGYRAIEIMADVPHAHPLQMTQREITRIIENLKRHNIEVSNINSFMLHAEGGAGHPSWIEKDEYLRHKRIDYTIRCIEMADALGCRTVSTEPGGLLKGQTFEEGLRLFKQGLLEVEGRALQKGVRVLIEPKPGLLIGNGSQFLELAKGLNPEAFGLNFDVGHFFSAGEDCEEQINRLKDLIHHFHIDDIASSREHYHLMPGCGVIDLSSVIKCVHNTGYSGYLTVDLHTYDDNPIDAAHKAFQYLSAI